MSKALVAYFSAGGSTKRLAETVASVTGGELFEIRPQTPYTREDLDWTNPRSRSSVEMNDKSSRPAILAPLPDVSQYDVVYLGFPIWWYVAPTIINSFLEGCELKGKTIVPFATSGGSGYGGTQSAISASAPGAVFKPGRVMKSRASADEIKSWIAGLAL